MSIAIQRHPKWSFPNRFQMVRPNATERPPQNRFFVRRWSAVGSVPILTRSPPAAVAVEEVATTVTMTTAAATAVATVAAAAVITTVTAAVAAAVVTSGQVAAAYWSRRRWAIRSPGRSTSAPTSRSHPPLSHIVRPTTNRPLVKRMPPVDSSCRHVSTMWHRVTQPLLPPRMPEKRPLSMENNRPPMLRRRRRLPSLPRLPRHWLTWPSQRRCRPAISSAAAQARLHRVEASCSVRSFTNEWRYVFARLVYMHTWRYSSIKGDTYHGNWYIYVNLKGPNIN